MLGVRPVKVTDEVLLVGTCEEPLPESKSRGGGGFGTAETPDATGRLLAGGGVQKEMGLGSPEDGFARGVYMLTLFLTC
jgi:hypothetical protein